MTKIISINFLLNNFINQNKYKPVEPIDYDEYIEKNANSLKKDNLKNLIFIQDDDIYVSFYALFFYPNCFLLLFLFVVVAATVCRVVLKVVGCVVISILPIAMSAQL